MSTTPKFRIGQSVYLTTDFGWGRTIPGVIEDIGEKNGQVVYDVALPNNDLRWGYEDQIRARN